MGAREDFYIHLKEDLIQNGKDSVLYEYIAAEQEAKAQKKDASDARSYQLRIRYYRNCMENEEITPLNYLIAILKVLTKSPKLCKKCGKQYEVKEEFEKFERLGEREQKKQAGYISDNPEVELVTLLETAGVSGLEAPELQQRLKQLLGILQNKHDAAYGKVVDCLTAAGYLHRNSEKMRKLVDAVLDVAVAYDIREFFSEMILEEEKKTRNKKGNGKRAARVDKTLCLLERYCRKKGVALFDATGTIRAGAMEYNTLLDVMNEKGDMDLFLPVCVDADTGCGIYILGLNYFARDEWTRLRRKGRRKDVNPERTCVFVVTDYFPENKTGDVKEYIKYLKQYTYSMGNTFVNYWDAKAELEAAVDDAMENMKEVFRKNKIPESVYRYKFPEKQDEVRQEARADVQRIKQAAMEKAKKAHGSLKESNRKTLSV